MHDICTKSERLQHGIIYDTQWSRKGNLSLLGQVSSFGVELNAYLPFVSLCKLEQWYYPTSRFVYNAWAQVISRHSPKSLGRLSFASLCILWERGWALRALFFLKPSGFTNLSLLWKRKVTRTPGRGQIGRNCNISGENFFNGIFVQKFAVKCGNFM